MNGVESYDEALDVGYRWYDATGQRPLFPFGYGLSYERFAVTGVRAFYNPFGGDAVRDDNKQRAAASGRPPLSAFRGCR